MNEITHIHLGRQPFTVSVDAHRQLRTYLDAINKAVDGNDDVVNEVELRMAELLAERGVTGDKVILKDDVTYLQTQLGEPADFGDESEQPKARTHEEPTSKRLFRDPEHAMFAGVCAGLANYFGIDVTIIRLILTALIFFGGGGLLLYGVLWLVMPEAKTGSERLQMQGKPVTVEALKQVVERVDVSGAAARVGTSVGRFVQSVARVLLGVIGVGLMVGGLALALATLTGGAYLGGHGLQIAENKLLPQNEQEVGAIVASTLAVLILAVFVLLAGRAMLRRKWTVPGWVTAVLVSVGLLATAAGLALGFSVAPTIGQRYTALHHSEWREQPVFAQVHIELNGVGFTTQNDSKYGVEIRTFGTVDTSGITTKVSGGSGGQLQIDSTHFKGPKHRCVGLCPYGPTNTEIVIHGPLPFSGDVSGGGYMNFDPQIAPPDPVDLQKREMQEMQKAQELAPPAVPKAN